MKHFDIIVTGKVQGVFFRASAKAEGGRLGLRGFVCNLPDGSVYLEAEGTESELAQLVAWCWEGPAHASVTNVTFTESAPKEFSEFEIRYA